MNNENKYNDILAMVTHDLKSPMTAIVSAFDFLELEDLTESEKKEALKVGRKSSRIVVKLIESILLMAKLEAGKEEITKKEIYNLDEHFYDITDTFKYEAKAKKIIYKTKIPKTLPKVLWDIDKLHYHVFNNILSNAMKFTPTDGTGKIKFIVEQNMSNNTIEISIKDNGKGIPLEKQNTIFSKYEMVEKEKKYKGSGLGLYNAFLFVKEHKGRIDIIKGIDKKGIGFKITLPID